MKPVSHTPLPLFGTSSPLFPLSGATSPGKSVRRPLLLWAAAAGLFVSVSDRAVAQDYALLTSKPQASAKRQEPTKAFWKMTTEPGADSTLVGFYTPENTLLHEEKLPNQAVTLTKRHLRKLNGMAEQLMQTDVANVAPNALLATLTGKASPKAGQLQISTYASRDGFHLHLMLDNPASDYVVVELLGKNGRTAYETATRTDKHHYKFNLAEMPAGDYQLRVSSKKQVFERNLSFSYLNPEPTPTLRIAIR